MDYQIAKNIPLPSHKGRHTMLKYPWPDMEPGDSILIEPPFTDSDSRKSPAGISAAMSGKRWLKLYRPEWYILCAREDDSIRIWVASTSVELNPGKVVEGAQV